jgi:hypothetical protein
MDETHYKSNSHKSRDLPGIPKESVSEKRVEKVVSGLAKPKKKTEVRKFADVFLSEDIGSVKSYILLDVLVPAIKKLFSDIITNGVDMILYGGTGRSGRNSSNASKISYQKYYDRDESRKPYNQPQNHRRNNFDYDEIIFETRGDAESVLQALEEVISQYGSASIADLYDLANMSTNNYTATKYGWNEIPSTCKPIRIRDGYILKLPRAVPLN